MQLVTFYTGGTDERLRIDSSGRLLYGKTSSTLETSLVLCGNSNSYTTNPGVLQLEMGNTPSNLASLGVISFGSQDKIGARIDGRADQDWTVNSARGTHIRFLTCDNGTTQLDERVRITSAGLVGIGSTAPTLALDINRGANSGVFLGNPTHGYKVRANVSGINDYGILIEDEDGVDLYRAVSSTGTSNADTHTFFTAGDERLRITSNGNIEVQGTRAGALQANDDDALKLFTKSTSDDINRGVGITFYTHDGSGYEMGGTIQVAKENGTANDPKSYMRFSTQTGSTTTEALRITSSGQVNIGGDYDQTTYKMKVTGTVAATNFDSLSDQKLKINIRKIESPIETVNKIDGVTFDWKEDNSPSMGVIAQNVEKVLPEIVSGDDTKSVNYSGLIGLLIEVVKDQQKQIDELRDRLDK